MENKKIKFSFLIPNLGYSNFLYECLDSVINQKNDGSFDFDVFLCDQSDPITHNKIVKDIDRLFRNNKNINVLFNKEKSVTLARHRMLSLCNADYVCFIDSDDYVDKDLLLTLSNIIYANNHPDIVITNFIYCDESDKDYKKNPIDKRIENNYLDYFLFTNALNSLCTKAINKKLYDVSDYSDFSNYNGEDFVMNYPIMVKAKSIICRFDICKYHYRQRKVSRISNITFESVIYTLKAKVSTPLSFPRTDFQRGLKLKMIISYFSDTVQKLLRSKKISKREFCEYIKYINDLIQNEQLIVVDELSKKEKMIFRLLCKGKVKTLWFLLCLASKR